MNLAALEQPVSLDAAEDGRVLVLDRGGRRLQLGRPGEPPAVFEPGFRSLRARFLGPHFLLLAEDDRLRTLTTGGQPVGELSVRPGARDVAVTRGGGVLVSYGRSGGHGLLLERLGPNPIEWSDPTLADATALAVESGGFWVAGTGAAEPAARAVRLQPAREGLRVRETVVLPAPPRSATVGPDGALYVLLEPGEVLVRVWHGAAGEPQRLPAPATELARPPKRLLACGARGLLDLTELVPPPSGPGPRFELPPCSP